MDYKVIGTYKYKDLEKFTYAQLEAEEIAKRRQYVILYEPNETNFDNLGIAVLNDCIEEPIITKELNGEYSFKATIFKDDRGKYKRVKPLCIIKAQGQLFRIPLWEGIKDNGFTVTINAKHIFWDLCSAFTEDRRVKEQNIYETLSRILEADYTGRFRIGVTDVTTVASANFIDENAVESIMKKVIPRWNAEMQLDNFKITMKKRLGKYKPNLFIRYGKNASSIKKKIDYSETCTRIYASGKDGIGVEDVNNQYRYIDSNKINNYPLIYPKKVKFDDMETPQEVKKAAIEYLNKYDVPLESIDIDVIDLLENKEYENLHNALQINLGDTVTIYDTDLNINQEIRCVSEEIHAITGIKLKIVLGQFVQTIADSMNDTEEQIKNTDEKVDSLKEDQGNASMEIEALKRNIEGIGKEIDDLNKTDAAITKRLEVIENKSLPVFEVIDIEVQQERQLIVLPESLRGKRVIVTSFSILQATEFQDFNIKDMDHSLENNTFYLISNKTNITVRIMAMGT